MQWTYSVIVKSEASKKVSEAMKDLTSSQENAAQTFKEVNNVLTSNFTENLVAALDERLREWQDSEEEGGMAQHFQQVHDNLLEVRAALVMLLDLKEGSFTNTLNALKLASVAMKETSATMEDAMVEMYKDMHGDIEFKSKQEARGIYEQIPSSILDPGSQSFFKFDEESKEFTGFNNKFLQAMIGNLDSVLQDYPETMARQIKDELNLFLESMGTGTQMFEKLLGKGTADYKNWKILQTGLGAITKVRKVFRENISDEFDPSGKTAPSKADEAVAQAISNPLMLGLEAVGNPRRWEQLKDALLKNLQKQLEESGSDVLKSVESFGIVSSIFGTVYDQIEKSLLTETMNQESTRKKASSIAQLTKGGLKLGKEEIFDLSALKDRIQEEISLEENPFGLDNIKDELEQTLLKSKAEFDPNPKYGDFIPLKDVILKNLEEANLSAIVKTTLAEVLQERQFDFGGALQTELGEMFSKITNEADKIIQLEKLSTLLAGVLEEIESVNELGITPGTTKEGIEGKNVIVDLESMLIDNFKEAKQHTDNWFRDGMVVGINSVLAQIEMMRTDMGFNMTQINTSINRIVIPNQVPATADQL